MEGIGPYNGAVPYSLSYLHTIKQPPFPSWKQGLTAYIHLFHTDFL